MRRLGALCTGSVLALAATGCMSTDADWRERYLEKERDANEANAKLSEERAAHAAAVAQLEEARGRLNSLERGRPAEASSPADVPAGPGVGADLDRMRKGGLDVHETADGNIAIVLPADITFGSGSKELTPAGRKSIDQVVQELQASFAGHSIRVEGHTDGDPIKKSNFKDNWELGSERALSVLRYLTSNGIAAERLTGATRGETLPVDSNKSDKGKARNRRVEIVVIVPRGTAMGK